MNQKHKIILEILAKAEIPLTIGEIREEMEPSELGLIGNGSDTSKIAEYLCRTKYWIEQGPSEVVNGKTRLTWRITRHGRDALAMQSLHPSSDTLLVQDFSHSGKLSDEELVEYTSVDNPLNQQDERFCTIEVDTADPLQHAIMSLMFAAKMARQRNCYDQDEKRRALQEILDSALYDSRKKPLIEAIKQDIEALEAA